MSDQQHCVNCLREVQGSYHYPCQQCAWSPDQHGESGLYLSPGTILHSQYQIGKMLGHGGFGITYLAWDNNLETKLAIKEYMPRDFATRNSTNAEVSTFAGDAKENFAYGLDRFLDEARTLAKFQQHVGIVSVLNFFKENGTGYMVMEYVDGLTLKDYFADKGKLSWDQTLKLFMPVMDALREVHKHGVLHRDISPDNIYLCQDNRIKLLDFGSARYALGGHSRSLSVVVKPGYAPEEQYRTKGKQGAWTDVYSVAASMYRCITGVVPPDALDRLDNDELIRPSKLGVQIPVVAEDAMMGALAVKADNRIQSIEDFQQALWDKKISGAENKLGQPRADVKIRSTETEAIRKKLEDIQAENQEKHAIDDFYKAAIGPKNQDYYLEQFSRFDKNGKTGISWHWPACFVTFCWLLYRKMWGIAFVYLIASTILLKVVNASSILTIVVYGFLLILPAIYANAIYYRFCNTNISEVKAVRQTLHSQLLEITKRGGTRSGILKILVSITIIGILSAIAIPAYQDYLAKAKAYSAQTRQQPQVEQNTQQAKPPNSVDDLGQRANDLYKQNLYDQAFPIILQLAEQNNPSWQSLLGYMYANAQGVNQDYQKAAQWFRKSANQGDAYSQYNLGLAYANGQGVTKDDNQAVQWIKKAADQGFASAQYSLGQAYSQGIGVTKDDQQAVQWYRKAADQGNPSAQYNLGVMYQIGKGVIKDDYQSVQWYRKAADQGNVSAQYNLGLAYANGQGVTKDDQQAVLWIQKAADQGYAYAQNHLGHMYSKGQGVTKDEQQAVLWYSKAAEQGSSRVQASAQVSLGWYYMNGIPNLPIDYKKAVYWNELGANNGEPEGFNNLGWQYENGLGVKQDFSKAAELYQNAITKGIENDVPKERIEEATSRLANIKGKIKAKRVKQ